MEHRNAQQLLSACVDGSDAEVWQEFRSRFESRLVAGVIRGFRRGGRYPRPDQLEDLLQETYCRLLERDKAALRRCSSSNETAVGIYLSRIAERVTIDWLRLNVAEKRGSGRVESLDLVAETWGDRALPTTPAKAEERLLCRERIERFLACCQRIAGKKKRRNLRILEMAFVDGLTSREISVRLNHLLSPPGIDAVLSRARARLLAEGFLLPRRPPLRAT